MLTFNTAKLKDVAREKLLGHYSRFILAFILSEFIFYLCFRIINVATYGMKYGDIFYYILMVAILLFNGLLIAGSAYIFLNFLTGRPYRVSDIFHCFKNNADSVLKLHSVFVIVEVVILVPVILLYNYYLDTKSSLSLIALLTWGIFGILLYLWFKVNFGICYYMLLDFPNLSTKQLFQLCRKLMRGHVGQYLYMTLSFIPLHLLGLVSFGTGYLWISPYMQAVQTQFYLNLVSEPSKERSNEA